MRPIVSFRIALVAAAFWLQLSAAGAAAQATAMGASPGLDLIELLETGPVVVVGTLSAPTRLDTHGWSARLNVEQALKPGPKRGAVLAVAWEELALSRPVRFGDGERVVLCLEPLPPQSIWRQRIPDPEARVSTLAVCDRGDGFLRRPSAGAVEILKHYLALGPALWNGPTAVGRLITLAEGAELPLARSAVTRLAKVPDLNAQIEPDSARDLVMALLRPDADAAFEDSLLDLVGQRHLEALRPTLETLTAGEGLAPPQVYAALGALDDGLGAARTARLLDSAEPRYRLIGVSRAGPESASTLAALMRSDADPAVRGAAVKRYLTLTGSDGLGPASSVLYDRDAQVRNAAAQALGDQDAAAVPYLVDVVRRGDPDSARAAVAALRFTETPEAAEALSEIAESNPDPGVRMLAKIALGRPVGHKD